MQTSDNLTAMTGKVFNIQRCSLHDGPGVRTTVFMKGCPLRCAWCQNPEGLTYETSVMYDKRKCISCKSCADKSKADGAEVCPAGALVAYGKEYTSDALVKLLLADADFFGSTGGVTFSGGECLLQSDFILECTKKLAEHKISVAIDTCGAVEFSNIEKLIPHADLFLYDIKTTNEEQHKKFTGMSNRTILENFEKLYKSGARIWVRIPIVNSFNTDRNDILQIKAFLDRFPNIEKIETLKYHELGMHKYEMLGREYTLGDEALVSDSDFERIKALLSKN